MTNARENRRKEGQSNSPYNKSTSGTEKGRTFYDDALALEGGTIGGATKYKRHGKEGTHAVGKKRKEGFNGNKLLSFHYI